MRKTTISFKDYSLELTPLFEDIEVCPPSQSLNVGTVWRMFMAEGSNVGAPYRNPTSMEAGVLHNLMKKHEVTFLTEAFHVFWNKYSQPYLEGLDILPMMLFKQHLPIIERELA